MNQKEAMQLTLKIAGIYILAQVILIYIPAVTMTIYAMTKGPLPTGNLFSSVMILVHVAALIVIGLVLTLYKFKLKGTTDSSTKLNIDIKTLGIAIAGLILFVFALRDLPILITQLSQSTQSTPQMELMGASNYIDNLMRLVGNLIQLILAGLFFLKAKYFGKLIR